MASLGFSELKFTTPVHGFNICLSGLCILATCGILVISSDIKSNENIAMYIYKMIYVVKG